MDDIKAGFTALDNENKLLSTAELILKIFLH